MPKITATSPATVRYATSLFQVASDRSVLLEIDKDTLSYLLKQARSVA